MSRDGLGTIDREVAAVALVTGAWLLSVIVAVYLAIVVVPHVVLGREGDIGSGLVLPVTATAVVAALLEPTRRWAARSANRLVRGRRAQPYEVLSRLAGTLPDPDPERAGLMAEVLSRGTGADEATIWLETGPSGLLRPIGHWPGEPPDPVTRETLQPSETRGVQPIVNRGEELGIVSIAKAAPGVIASVDELLLADAAGSLVLPLRNRRLVAALEDRVAQVRASRARLIETHDRERRLLERDLHDGAQQHLVALRVRLGLVSTVAGQAGDDALAAALDELAGVAGEVIDAVRGVAQGIYPPLLESSGLGAALRSLAPPPGVTVELTGEIGERFDRSTEETAYFCVVELLKRAAAAGATEVAATVTNVEGPGLRIVLVDDGGGDRPARSSIVDRVEAAGGSMEVSPGAASRAEIVLPANERSGTA